MRKTWIGVAMALGLLLTLPKAAPAQQALPIAGVDAAVDLPNEHETPDPSLTYKLVFDIGKAASKVDEVNPGLIVISRYFNTLAKGGVPADHRKFVVVFHQEGTPVSLNSATFRALNDGHDNPNIAMIHTMKQAGIDFRVCGQALISRKLEPSSVLPDVQVDQWALTTLTNLQLRGYVRVAGM